MRCDCKECSSESWFDGVPGIILTIITLAVFVAGCWAMLAIWNMGEFLCQR